MITVVYVVLLPLLLAAPGDVKASGVPNFHQVDEHVYRGGQATSEGFQSLAKLGLKTVIDLRGGEERVGTEEELVKAAGMRYVNVPMQGLGAPTDDQIRKVLAILNDASTWPVFVHCKRGKDRTGVVIASYRIAHNGWPNQQALDEARSYGMSWIERGMQQYVLHFKVSDRVVFSQSAPN